MQRIDITNNATERISLVVGDMSFILIHDDYREGRTWAMSLNPREARALTRVIERYLPGIELRSGVTTS